MHQAQDTFVADLADGTVVRVVKGEYLPDAHELVKRDQDGAGILFRKALVEDDPPAKKPASRGAKQTAAAS